MYGGGEQWVLLSHKLAPPGDKIDLGAVRVDRRLILMVAAATATVAQLYLDDGDLVCVALALLLLLDARDDAPRCSPRADNVLCGGKGARCGSESSPQSPQSPASRVRAAISENGSRE